MRPIDPSMDSLWAGEVYGILRKPGKLILWFDSQSRKTVFSRWPQLHNRLPT